MVKILKDNLLKEINKLDRTCEFYDTISEYVFKRILKNTEENLFNKLIHNDIKYFQNLCLKKLQYTKRDFYFKPLLSLANNVFNDEEDGALLDDILLRLKGVAITKYFYDSTWSLNLYVYKEFDKCIKLIANRLTEEMYNILGEDFFKKFDKKGYAISIDKNYCNSNFGISKVLYRYSDTGYNRNFAEAPFETLVVRIDKVELIKERFKDGNYVMEFHKNRYKLENKSS